MKSRYLSAVAAGALVSFFGIIGASSASAATLLYNLSVADSTAGLGAGPFGTVGVTENAGALNFLVTLASGYNFRNAPDSNHSSFTFDLDGVPAGVAISSLTPMSYSFASTGPVNQVPFGAFGYSLECGTCSSGWTGGYSGPLAFTVSDTAHDLTLASLGFTHSNTYGNVYFSADLINPTGFSGNVGALAGALTTGVPEPATWAMMLIGFGAVGFMMRGSTRKKLDILATA